MNDMTEPADDTLLTAIRVSGKDRIEFLQGQLTQDLAGLSPQQPLLAGWNSPKGRLFLISWVADWQDAVWLAVPAPLAAAIARRLTMFVLRADVRIECSPLRVWPTINNSSKDDNLTNCYSDDNFLRLQVPGGGWQIAGDTSAASSGDWRLANIRAGMPVVWPQNSEAFVPQMVNLDLLGGISFSKGCYVGQEIVARTQNLGRIKRRMFRFRADSSAIAPGDQVMADGTRVGTVVDAVDGNLLAVVRLAELTAQLSVGGAPLRLAELPYAVPETT